MTKATIRMCYLAFHGFMNNEYRSQITISLIKLFSALETSVSGVRLDPGNFRNASIIRSILI